MYPKQNILIYIEYNYRSDNFGLFINKKSILVKQYIEEDNKN